MRRAFVARRGLKLQKELIHETPGLRVSLSPETLLLAANRFLKQSMPQVSCNPTKAVGGSFILGLQLGRRWSVQNPTNCVGGESPAPQTRRLSMNNPPTALVGFGKAPRRRLS